MRALLLIDIQNDFLPGGSLAVPRGHEIIPLINSLQERFPLVIATQDWHPPQHKSFASSHSGRKPFETIQWMGYEQVLWPEHCIQGSEGAGFSAALHTNKVAAIFRKGMNPDIDSYSGFYDNRHLNSTGLSSYLRGLEIKEVFLAGLAGDYCVNFTARDALGEGYQSFLIEDATRPISIEGFEMAKAAIKDQGGKVINSRDLSFL